MNPVETTGRLAGSARSLLAAPEHVQIAKLQKQVAVALQRVEGLEAEKRVKAEMSFRSPFWFREGDPHPFCKLCWEVREKLVHLEAPFEHTYGGFGYGCGNCDTDYRVEKLLPGTALVPFTSSRDSGVFSIPRSSRFGDLFKY